MKKKILTLFFMASALCFAESKYNIEDINFKEENNLFYKQEADKKILLNESVEIFSKENQEIPIFKLNFKNGEIKVIEFSNKNKYFSPQNTEEKLDFAFKKMNEDNFSGSLKYSKSKAEEIKKEEKTENGMTSFFSSSSASSMVSYSGEFGAEEVEEFFEKFLENKDEKVIIKKSDVDELMSKN